MGNYMINEAGIKDSVNFAVSIVTRGKRCSITSVIPIPTSTFNEQIKIVIVKHIKYATKKYPALQYYTDKNDVTLKYHGTTYTFSLCCGM